MAHLFCCGSAVSPSHMLNHLSVKIRRDIQEITPIQLKAPWGGQVRVPGAVTQLEQPASGPLQELKPSMLMSREGTLLSVTSRSKTHDVLARKTPVGKRAYVGKRPLSKEPLHRKQSDWGVVHTCPLLEMDMGVQSQCYCGDRALTR